MDGMEEDQGVCACLKLYCGTVGLGLGTLSTRHKRRDLARWVHMFSKVALRLSQEYSMNATKRPP